MPRTPRSKYKVLVLSAIIVYRVLQNSKRWEFLSFAEIKELSPNDKKGLFKSDADVYTYVRDENITAETMIFCEYWKKCFSYTQLL